MQWMTTNTNHFFLQKTSLNIYFSYHLIHVICTTAHSYDDDESQRKKKFRVESSSGEIGVLAHFDL